MVHSLKNNTIEACSKCNRDHRWRRKKMSARKKSSRKVWLHQILYMLEFLDENHRSSMWSQRLNNKTKKSILNIIHNVAGDEFWDKSYRSSTHTQRMKKMKKKKNKNKSILNTTHNVPEDTCIYNNGHDCNFIRKVLREELGDHHQIEDNHNLMAIVVHAVLLDSGFVGFDINSRDGVHRIHEIFPDDWATASFSYTLPQILANNNDNKKVNLEFEKVGQCLIVSGSLPGPGSEIYQVFLYDHKYKLLGSLPDVVLRELWIRVKDGLALPLLMDLCAKARLPGPACLMGLPSDLQIKILDFLPGDDVARLECTCKELMLLTRHSSDIWSSKLPACTCDINLPPKVSWKSNIFECYYTEKKCVDNFHEERDKEEKRKKMRAIVEKKGHILLPKSSIRGSRTSNIPFNRFRK